MVIIPNLRDINAFESESGIIATLIHNPDFVYHSEQLLPEYFTDSFNREIYLAITDLVNREIKNIDVFNIKEALGVDSKITIEQIQELVEVSDTIARGSLAEYKLLVTNVVDAAFRRDVYTKLKECEAMCLSGDSVNIEQDIYKAIDDVMLGFNIAGNIPIFKDVIDDLWNEVEERQDGSQSGMKFKFPTLNEYVTIEKGELVVVGALMKAGKSMFLMNCAAQLLKEDKAVFYIDSELNSRLWLTRLMSHMTGIEFSRIKSGNYTEEERQKIYETKQFLKTRKLVHLYMPFFDIEGIYTAVKKIHHVMPIDVLIVDYFKSGDSLEAYTNYAQLGRLVDMCKNEICGAMSIAGLAAAQAAQGGEKLADSAKIARNASTIMMLIDKTPEEILEDGVECGNKKLIVTLNRNGMQHAPGEYIDLNFNGNIISFEEAKQHVSETPY